MVSPYGPFTGGKTYDPSPCQRCTQSWYSHNDHAHNLLTRTMGRCPFGDCGDYKGD